MTKIIDISPAISHQTAVWPGDTPFSQRILMSLKKGDNIDLSTITTTVHIGAHADAPSHYVKGAVSVDQVDLATYYGPCRVINAQNVKLIEPHHCEKVCKTGIKRVLFRTLSFPDPQKFNKDFAGFSPDAIEFLGRNDVVLIGIDTPSIDPFKSKDLPAHKMIAKWNIRNLESLDLRHVEEGEYNLVAFPLKLVDCDASPVRAVLLRK